PEPVVAIRFEAREQRRYGAARRRQLGLIDPYLTRNAGTRSHDEVVGRRSIDLCSSDADAAARGGVERLEARQLGPEDASPANGCTGVGHDFGRAACSGPDDQVENAITVEIAHHYIDAAFKAGKRDDGGDEPVAVAVVQTDLGRFAGGAWNGHRI